MSVKWEKSINKKNHHEPQKKGKTMKEGTLKSKSFKIFISIKLNGNLCLILYGSVSEIEI